MSYVQSSTIDPTIGSHVLGREVNKIITTCRDDLGDNFVHRTIGKVKYSQDWIVIDIDDEICRYYATMVERTFGIKIHWKSMWDFYGLAENDRNIHLTIGRI